MILSILYYIHSRPYNYLEMVNKELQRILNNCKNGFIDCGNFQSSIILVGRVPRTQGHHYKLSTVINLDFGFQGLSYTLTKEKAHTGEKAQHVRFPSSILRHFHPLLRNVHLYSYRVQISFHSYLHIVTCFQRKCSNVFDYYEKHWQSSPPLIRHKFLEPPAHTPSADVSKQLEPAATTAGSRRE